MVRAGLAALGVCLYVGTEQDVFTEKYTDLCFGYKLSFLAVTLLCICVKVLSDFWVSFLYIRQQAEGRIKEQFVLPCFSK